MVGARYHSDCAGHMPDKVIVLRPTGVGDPRRGRIRDDGNGSQMTGTGESLRTPRSPSAPCANAAATPSWGRHLRILFLVLWGADGALDTKPVLDVWRDYATATVTGHAVANCGHYLPKEQPIAVAAKISEFFVAPCEAG
jgi:pimeloyl-ACP methyl ester carboxylesterase